MLIITIEVRQIRKRSPPFFSASLISAVSTRLRPWTPPSGLTMQAC